ncbi:hypothetical protein [Streptomyces sp. NPDC002779]|uniref:hypothetical protein n=1 Tax=Streptomyces sp. NPDC002779 TaxID=3364664 RepID=UPI003679D67A
MPFPPPPRLPSGPRRRSLLAAVTGAAVLVGCSPGSDTDGTAGSPSAADRARARAARDSAELVDRYDAVIAAHPALADRLRPLRAEVLRHAEAFGGTAAAGPGTPSAPATGPAVPSDAKGALAELAAAERTLSDRRIGALSALPGELARLLASVAASGAAHVYLLTEGAA